MAGERALVLVPCCKKKVPRPFKIETGISVAGILPLREHMVDLAGDITTGPAVPAVSLYDGALYSRCQESMGAVANGRYPQIDLLIVSAYYGLVHPAEPIAKYDLCMDDDVAGMKAYRFWQQMELGAVLEDYVRRRKVTNVWSLLASQYRKALNPFWKDVNGTVNCWQVTVPGGGQSNPARRGDWLERVLATSPAHLLEGEPVPESVAPQGGWAASGKRPIEYERV